MLGLRLRDGHTVVLLGEGQVGRAIGAHLLPLAVDWRRSESLWTSPAECQQSTQEALGNELFADTTRMTTIWAAGVVGMTSEADACHAHLETAKAAIGSVLDATSAANSHSVHIVSSAGAHAHGATRWKPSDPRPTEPPPPYVAAKFAEEEWALALDGVQTTVHRVASVYSHPGQPGRVGMIGTLVRNAVMGRVTPIYANRSTLRNYVHADDVGRFIAGSVLAPDDVRHPTLLAAPRSHRIDELLMIIGRLLRRPVPVRMVKPLDPQDHSFDPNHIHPAFSARPVETAMRQFTTIDDPRQLDASVLTR